MSRVSAFSEKMFLYSSGSIPFMHSGGVPETVLPFKETDFSAPSSSYSRVPSSVLPLAGYLFLLLSGERVSRMNSMVEVFPLSLGP